MQFDPKIVHPDEGIFAQDDLKLPDDLALMGEQLADDAARLASSYPARLPSQLATPHQEAPRKGGRWLSGTLTGGLLAVALVSVSLVGTSFFRAKKPGNEPPTPSTAVAVSEALAPDASHEPIPVTPASWLGDTSGPELEALMDLWERDQHEVATLSF